MNRHKARQYGVFYTELFNPFKYKPFVAWAKEAALANSTVLEPFAGSNSIISMLQEIGICDNLGGNYRSYDIDPKNASVKQRDTINDFPSGYSVCVTNPPWLYKSSAKRQGLHYPNCEYDNIYKHCLDLALKNCDYVAFLIPASFITANLFTDRLDSLITINKPLFKQTDNPVCLALFNKHASPDVKVFSDEELIGSLTELKKHLPRQTANIRFNDENGELGLIAIDNTKGPSIKFCPGEALAKYSISHSSRSITKIGGMGRISSAQIALLNSKLNQFRLNTRDIFLTAFKGLRSDGFYRRRLDYQLARGLIGENL